MSECNPNNTNNLDSLDDPSSAPNAASAAGMASAASTPNAAGMASAIGAAGAIGTLNTSCEHNAFIPVTFTSIYDALATGTDTADDLTALELALTAAIDEEDPLDPERRQSALRAIARQLRDHADLLHYLFAYLWSQR